MRWLMNRDRVIQRRMSQSDTILFSSFLFSFFSCGRSPPLCSRDGWMDVCGVLFLLFPHFPIFYFGFSLFPPLCRSDGCEESSFINPPRKNLLVILCCVESFNFAFLLLFISFFLICQTSEPRPESNQWRRRQRRVD